MLVGSTDVLRFLTVAFMTEVVTWQAGIAKRELRPIRLPSQSYQGPKAYQAVGKLRKMKQLWRRGVVVSVVGLINEVTVINIGLGWVTVFLRVNHLGM